MTAADRAIQHVSDTARWAAVYRARETERADAVFRDPFARRLAGERGEEIARAFPFHEKNTWSWIARTYAFDGIIREQLAQGVDLVVNLAAGLDARPYRMDLPSSVRWVEVDLPELLDYKEGILSGEKPKCQLERVRMDLADAGARRELFERLASKGTKALIISEGLSPYLSEEEVGALAEDLARPSSFQRWVLDLMSPGLLRMVQKNTHEQFGDSVARLKFAPANGSEFFSNHGWKLLEVRSILKTAAKINRLAFVMRLFSLLPENPVNAGSRPWSGVYLMGRS
ncbi:MAG TPA: class I SAM-dependent methyltransferase [Candidatus Acidoferrales bacterium]|nr:class I SAM-dependent methyltransferase [Candidatus Acidoferrales bacterium]